MRHSTKIGSPVSALYAPFSGVSSADVQPGYACEGYHRVPNYSHYQNNQKKQSILKRVFVGLTYISARNYATNREGYQVPNYSRPESLISSLCNLSFARACVDIYLHSLLLPPPPPPPVSSSPSFSVTFSPVTRLLSLIYSLP